MNPTLFTLAAARDALWQREISALELTEFFLQRIADYNPTLNLFITLTAEAAREQAARADAEFARGIHRSALHGIPIGLKDLFNTRGIPTTAGSKLLRDNIPVQDAAVVARLRQAGAVLPGKLNMHEFAYGVTNENPHFGDAKNPWAPENITGGSSGGSAAAVAARLCLGALGSDTGGSIRIPAAMCGVTGLKPTYGRVSLRGVIPLSWSNDHAGPLAQTAHDCALILNVIAGYDAADPASYDMPVPDFTASLNDSPRGLRFATPRGYFTQELDGEIADALQAAVRVFQDMGMTHIDKELVSAEQMFHTNRVILRIEAAAYHRDTLARQPEVFGQDVLERLQSFEEFNSQDYALAKRAQTVLNRELELWFEDVDLMLVPTTNVAAPRRGTDAVAMSKHLTAFTAPFDVTGFPAASVPCGFTRGGLPIGMQIVGKRWQEAQVLQAAHQYQLVTDWHARVPEV